jgi:hypothetical protein
MKIVVLRTPGLDLLHDLAAKGVTGAEHARDLVEGEAEDIPDNVAEALIACGVVRAADKAAPHAAAHPAPKPHKEPPPAKT